MGLIVWHFTGDPAQAAAGLLHDVATPPFAHVVDFLRGDHLTQEATESGTREIIESSPDLQAVLKQYGLSTDQVADYHVYPIADNDSPRLSADRLEYTLGNALNYGLLTRDEIAALYSDLTVAANEEARRSCALPTGNRPWALPGLPWPAPGSTSPRRTGIPCRPSAICFPGPSAPVFCPPRILRAPSRR